MPNQNILELLIDYGENRIRSSELYWSKFRRSIEKN